MQNETNEFLRKKCGTRVIRNGESMIYPLSCREDFEKCILYSENKDAHIRSILNWNPMSENWKNNCRDKFWFQDNMQDMLRLHPKMDPGLYELKKKLLAFAGESVCLPAYEEDLDNMLLYGQFWIGNNIKMMRGLPSQCHYNAGRCYEANKDKVRICTGYALSPDGMWRQHSFLVWMKERSNQIVETTVPRIAYFGFVMTKEQSNTFANDNF